MLERTSIIKTSGREQEKMSVYQVVIFDMDGVIFDSERVVKECWIELAEKYGIPGIEAPYSACIGTTKARTRQIMLEAYGPEFPFDQYEKEVSQIYHATYDGGRLPMKPGIVALLSFLKEQGKGIALASSTRSRTVTDQLKSAHIFQYFDAVICGDMVEKSKPAPDIFLKACEALQVCPGEAFGIEDSYNGIRALHAGGLRPVMVPDLLPVTEEMRSIWTGVPL